MDNSYDKQLKEVITIIKRHNYSLPIINDLCKIYNINPQDLKPKPIEDFIDKQTCTEIHELRRKHFETRRKSQLNFLASKIIDLKLKPSQMKFQTLSQIYFPSTTVTPRSSTKIKSTDFFPLTPTMHPLHQKQIEMNKKKLSRALKFVTNIEAVKSLDELKKSELIIKDKKKQERIKEEKLYQELMRQKKISIINEKREKHLNRKCESLSTLEKEGENYLNGSKTSRDSLLSLSKKPSIASIENKKFDE